MTYHSKRIIIFEDVTHKGGTKMQTTMPNTKKRKEYAMLAIEKQLHRDVKAFCAAEGVSMISLVEALLRGYMKQRKTKEV